MKYINAINNTKINAIEKAFLYAIEEGWVVLTEDELSHSINNLKTIYKINNCQIIICTVD